LDAAVTERRRRGVLPIAVETAAGRLVVPVPLASVAVEHEPDGGVTVRVGAAEVRGRPVQTGDRDAALPPVTGADVAVLPRAVLQLVAEAWMAEVQRARRRERAAGADSARLAALATALGQARVLRAVAGDVVQGKPTAADFDAATAAGLLLDRRPAPAQARLEATDSPLERQLAVGDAVQRHLDSTGVGVLRSRSAFAGITTAAALVLTGCGTSSGSGDRRCTDASGRVVDDTNCRTYGGGGGGGYFYRYGGSTYSGPGGGTYINGGSNTAPKGGSGFFGRSGGGS
jgi:hypothetical protein